MRRILIVWFLFLPLLAGAEKSQDGSFHKQLALIETDADGRTGISAINTANNSRLDYRADERFSVQSTMKMMVAANILKKSLDENNLLEKRVFYKQSDLVVWSPITEKHLEDGMTIFDLSAAAISYSDNTAANLLIKELGGPATVTAFARFIGDNMFRLDNWEPHMNSNPKKLKDTSTPSAMANSLQTLVFGNILPLKHRTQLLDWLKANTTGDARIRAGVPTGWIVGDKTGSGDYGITNDIGIIWPAKCQPIVLAIYYRGNKKDAPRREDIVASATRLVIREFAKTDQCIAQIGRP